METEKNLKSLEERPEPVKGEVCRILSSVRDYLLNLGPPPPEPDPKAKSLSEEDEQK